MAKKYPPRTFLKGFRVAAVPACEASRFHTANYFTSRRIMASFENGADQLGSGNSSDREVVRFACLLAGIGFILIGFVAMFPPRVDVRTGKSVNRAFLFSPRINFYHGEPSLDPSRWTGPQGGPKGPRRPAEIVTGRMLGECLTAVSLAGLCVFGSLALTLMRPDN